MANFINIDGNDFDLSPEGANLSERALREAAVPVRTLDVEIAESYPEDCIHREFAVKGLAAKGVSLDTHVVVGSYYEDLTYFCEYEGKLEHGALELTLMVPKSLMAESEPNPSEVRAWDQAASLGYQDWA